MKLTDPHQQWYLHRHQEFIFQRQNRSRSDDLETVSKGATLYFLFL
jgi:hypothetical protein